MADVTMVQALLTVKAILGGQVIAITGSAEAVSEQSAVDPAVPVRASRRGKRGRKRDEPSPDQVGLF